MAAFSSYSEVYAFFFIFVSSAAVKCWERRKSLLIGDECWLWRSRRDCVPPLCRKKMHCGWLKNWVDPSWLLTCSVTKFISWSFWSSRIVIALEENGKLLPEIRVFKLEIWCASANTKYLEDSIYSNTTYEILADSEIGVVLQKDCLFVFSNCWNWM